MSEIIKTIRIDLASQSVPSVVDAMQGDSLTRGVDIHLYNGNVPYQGNELTNGAFSVAFKKPDGIQGWYDTLPNGIPAVEESQTTPGLVTVLFAPAMLEVAGHVQVTVILRDQQTRQLASFPFLVNVVENPSYGNQISNEYYNIKTFDEFYAKLLNTFIAAGSDIELSGHKIGGISELVFPGSHQGEFVSITTDSASQDTPALVFSGLDDEYESFNPPVLRHVSDGIEDGDVATVGQVKAVNLLHEYGIKIPSKYNGSIVSAEPFDVKDENGYITHIKLRFLGATGDEPVKLIGLYPGHDDSDAATVGQLNAAIGDIETALDSIIAIQESLIGGESA